MPSFERLILTLSILFSFFELKYQYSYNGFQIRDLEYSDSNFITEAYTWSWSGLASSLPYTTCSGYYLLGGHNVLATICNIHYGNYGWCSQWGSYFKKTYTGLPAHSYVYVAVTYWAFYTWDITWDYFELDFDGMAVPGWKMSGGSFPTTSCGGLATSPNMRVFGRFAHSASSLTVTFYSRLDEATNNESWGVRDLKLTFAQSPVSPSSYFCAAPASIPNLPLSWYCTNGGSCDVACDGCFGTGSNQCYACRTGYFWNGLNCLACDSRCTVCYGTANTQCKVCAPGKFFWGGNTCLDACDAPLRQFPSDSTGITVPTVVQTLCKYPCTQGFYLDWNNQCQGSCVFPLQATTSRTSQEPIYVCNYPCAINQYLYWDGMCENSCSTPVYNDPYNGRNMCKFPCNTAPDTIAYWNGDCRSTCAFPLVYVIEHDKQFCTNPCSASPGYWLYNNGSCLPTCQRYFTTSSISGQLLCNYPCASNQYLYTNGSCLPTCDYRFYNLTMLADKYCYYPCLPTEYMYNNGSCLSNCDWRFNILTTVTVEEKYCNFPCAGRLYLYLNGSCLAYCSNYFSPWFDRKFSANYYCDNPCNTTRMINNGTCTTNCDPRFISYSLGSDQFCDYPCPPSHYLYKNGTCLRSCAPYYNPSDYGGDRFCDHPCATTNEYINYNGSCLANCDPPYLPQTFGSDRFCRSPCKAGDYLYSNNTCLSWCAPGFIESSYGSDLFCTYPCKSGEHLYQDGSCKTSCQTYFIPVSYGTDRFCYYPCPVDHYLYQNGSCLSSCNPLFVEMVSSITGLKSCNHPCSVSTDWIYWDGTCKSSCLPPLKQRTEGTNKFCVSPCLSDSEYLYWNSSCFEACDYPLKSRTENGVKYCEHLCVDPMYPILRWDGQCVSDCQFPLRPELQGSKYFCLPPCQNTNEYYYYVETGDCRKSCPKPYIASSSTKSLYKTCSASGVSENSGFLNFLSTPSTNKRDISYITLARMIQYVKYFDMTLPPRLQRLSYGKGNPPLCLSTVGLLIPEDVFPTFSQQILPVVFWKHGLSEGFLANFWQPLMLLSLLLVVGSIFAIIEFLCGQAKWLDWKEIFERCRVIVIWNLIIMVIATNLDHIILYSTLEIKTVRSQDSKVNVASLFFCIVGIIAAVSVLVTACIAAPKIHVIRPSSKGKPVSMQYADFLTKWQSIQVVFRGFREDSIMAALFYAFYMVRFSLPSLIASVLYTSPLEQSCLQIAISVTFIWYLLHSDPLKKRISQIQLVVTELMVFAVNVCIIILSISDNQKADNYNTRVFLGDIIIVCNFGINIIGTVFLGIKLILGIRAAISLGKKRAESAKIAWLQLIFLPFQQAGFGFEQVQITKFFHDYQKLTNYKGINKSDNLRTQALKSQGFSETWTNSISGMNNSQRMSYYSNLPQNSEGSDLYGSFPINRITKRIRNGSGNFY